MNLNNDCLIEASGNYFTEHFTSEMRDWEDEQLIAFISDKKCQAVETEDDDWIYNRITELAESLERFVSEQLTKQRKRDKLGAAL
jgi:hypothetical protein